MEEKDKERTGEKRVTALLRQIKLPRPDVARTYAGLIPSSQIAA